MISEQQMRKIRDFLKSCRWGADGDNMKHTSEVVRHALWLQERFGGRRDIIEAAAWLHDVGKAKLRIRQEIGNYKETHEPVSAETAREFLKGIGTEAGDAAQIVSAVRNHGKHGSGMPEKLEDRIICVADKMAIMTDGVKRRVFEKGMSKEDAQKMIEAGKSVLKDIGTFRGAEERVRKACEEKLRMLEDILKS